MHFNSRESDIVYTFPPRKRLLCNVSLLLQSLPDYNYLFSNFPTRMILTTPNLTRYSLSVAPQTLTLTKYYSACLICLQSPPNTYLVRFAIFQIPPRVTSLRTPLTAS